MADTRWNTYALGIDVSRYQAKLDASLLKGNIDFMIAKAGQYNWSKDHHDLGSHVDSMFASHVQTAADLGIPCGAYWFFDPTVPQDPVNALDDWQIQMLQYALHGKRVHFIAIDVEMFEDPNSKGTIVTNHQISTNARQFSDRVQKLFPDLPVMIYTGNWFVNQYAPDMKVWMDTGHWPVWLAQYPSTVKAAAQWADFRGGAYAPEWPADKVFPWLSNQACTIWQWSGDCLTAPGVYGDAAGTQPSALDLNFYNGTKAMFYKWLNFAPVTIPVTPPPDNPPVVVPPVTPPVVVDARTIEARVAALETWAKNIGMK